MIQECKKAGCLKKCNISGLVNLDKPRLEKVRESLGGRVFVVVLVVVVVVVNCVVFWTEHCTNLLAWYASLLTR